MGRYLVRYGRNLRFRGGWIMPGDETVTCWLRQLETGDGDAARHLWQRYYRELVELARTRLGTTPRRASDEEDVALSVLRCLYEGAARGQFTTLVNRRELWQLLATITGRKVIAQQRYLNQQKRGGGQVRGDSVLQGSNGDRSRLGFDGIPGDAPTPEVLAITAEEYQRLMTLLDDDRLRQIAQCKLEGYTNAEIGKRLGLTCRSIERKLRSIRHVWEGELAQ
jgi:DNA-directed RNA polymerase specialized sigma24 family protein